MKCISEFNPKEMVGSHSAELRLKNVKEYIRLRKKLDLLKTKRDAMIERMRELRTSFSVFEFEYLARDSRKQLKEVKK